MSRVLPFHALCKLLRLTAELVIESVVEASRKHPQLEVGARSSFDFSASFSKEQELEWGVELKATGKLPVNLPVDAGVEVGFEHSTEKQGEGDLLVHFEVWATSPAK